MQVMMTAVTVVDDGDDGSYKEGSERGQPPSRVLPPPPGPQWRAISYACMHPSWQRVAVDAS